VAARPLWIGAVAAGAPPVLNLLTSGTSLTVRWSATAGLVVLALLGFSVPWLRARAGERSAAASRADALTSVADALRPLLATTAAAVRDRGNAADAVAKRTEAVSLVLMTATKLCNGGERTRACWYEVQGRGAGRRLTPVRHWGRGATPRTSFKVTEPRGRDLLALLDDDRGELWTDLAAKRPANWQPTDVNDVAYATFLAVPVRSADGRLFGMLTVDSPTPGALTVVEVEMARMLAEVLAVAYAGSGEPAVGAPTRS
jgi:GAF domain-containing protein